MRIRFVKEGTFDGFKTSISDGNISIEDTRLSVLYGQVFEVKDYSLARDGMIDVQFDNDTVYRVGRFDIELSAPSIYQPDVRSCCEDKK